MKERNSQEILFLIIVRFHFNTHLWRGWHFGTLKVYSTFSLRIYRVYDWIRHIIQTFVILMRREILVGKQIVSKINTSCIWNRKVKASIDNLIFIKINITKIIIIIGRSTNCIMFFKCILCYSVILNQMGKDWFWKHGKVLIIITYEVQNCENILILNTLNDFIMFWW